MTAVATHEHSHLFGTLPFAAHEIAARRSTSLRAAARRHSHRDRSPCHHGGDARPADSLRRHRGDHSPARPEYPLQLPRDSRWRALNLGYPGPTSHLRRPGPRRLVWRIPPGLARVRSSAAGHGSGLAHDGPPTPRRVGAHVGSDNDTNSTAGRADGKPRRRVVIVPWMIMLATTLGLVIPMFVLPPSWSRALSGPLELARPVFEPKSVH